MRSSLPKFSIEHGNVVDFRCEVLALKYAQGWYGADAAVSKRLNLLWDQGPKPGRYRVDDPFGKVRARTVVFSGTTPLRSLTYSSVRSFGQDVIRQIHDCRPDTKQVAMTLHGVSVGLDEREAFLSQLDGVVEALSDGALPHLQEVVFVELNPKRVARMVAILSENYPALKLAPPEVVPSAVVSVNSSATVSTTPVELRPEPKEKPHVFVAMPFTGDMEDVFIFGIQSPVQSAGLLCERVDMAVFNGDILDRIKSRIESALLVVCDLTGANANVYLEVGYAWGKGKDTLLLCRNVDDLKFDVRGQRCLIYASINDLNKKITEELKSRVSSVI